MEAKQQEVIQNLLSKIEMLLAEYGLEDMKVKTLILQSKDSEMDPIRKGMAKRKKKCVKYEEQDGHTFIIEYDC